MVPDTHLSSVLICFSFPAPKSHKQFSELCRAGDTRSPATTGAQNAMKIRKHPFSSCLLYFVINSAIKRPQTVITLQISLVAQEKEFYSATVLCVRTIQCLQRNKMTTLCKVRLKNKTKPFHGNTIHRACSRCHAHVSTPRIKQYTKQSPRSHGADIVMGEADSNTGAAMTCTGL